MIQGGDRARQGRLALRTIAVVIAVAAIVDPAWSIDRPESERLVAVDLTAGAAGRSITALRGALPSWDISIRTGLTLGVPCARDERCVIVADGSIDAALPMDLARPPSLISVRADREPNVALRSVSASTAHVSTAGALRIHLERKGRIAETSITVRDGAAVVGSLTYKWSETANAAVDVPWWPLDGGARTLRVEAAPVEGEASVVDNVIDVGVAVLADRVQALVFDARPAWNSTFVRRALEDDPRMDVEHRARVAPALTTGTRGGVLDAETLESIPVVIVGDPDALTAADVALLERYARVRGGSLILLPERRITGPAAQLLPGNWSEHLVSAPERVGPLQASEILRGTNLPLTAMIVAQSGGAPSIASLATGRGRVIISGAMDAWRFRDASFDDFWRSTVMSASLAGSALQINVDSALASRGTRVPLTVRFASFAPWPALEVKVDARCGGGEFQPVRVWPSSAIGELAGELAVTNQACEVRASAGDRIATTHVAVAQAPSRGVDATLDKLGRSVLAVGGTTAVAGEEATFARVLASSFTPTSRIVSIRPMRSAWWILPFAGCLAAEWWLRRRHGLI